MFGFRGAKGECRVAKTLAPSSLCNSSLKGSARLHSFYGFGCCAAEGGRDGSNARLRHRMEDALHAASLSTGHRVLLRAARRRLTPFKLATPSPTKCCIIILELICKLRSSKIASIFYLYDVMIRRRYMTFCMKPLFYSFIL